MVKLSFNALLAKLTGKFPLQLTLSIPFVLQIFAAVGLVGYLSFKSGQEDVNEVATQLRIEISDRIRQYLDSYLKIPHQINQLNANSIRLGEFNLDDLPSLKQHLWHQMQVFDSVTQIQFGTEKGEYISIERVDKKFRLKAASELTDSVIRVYTLDEQGNFLQVVRSRPDYDVHNRPWYKVAVNKGKASWSEIYSLFTFPKLSIAGVLPIYDEQHQLIGVADVDLLLSDINDFLRSLTIGRTGQTFIIERSGMLVATSTPEKPFTVENNIAKQLKATDSSNLITQQATRFLVNKFGNLGKIVRGEQLDFMIEGQRYFLGVLPLRDSKGLDWLIVVVVPETDFMERMQANKRHTILLCLAALAIATAIGILTARWIARPIQQLSAASQAIATGDLNQHVAVKGSHELRTLAQSFNQMAQQLRESFHALEIVNSELENRVERRTGELQVANQEITALNQRLKAENRRMSTELEITRQLQHMILPKEEELKAVPGLDIAGFMQPAEEVGGDYYDVLQENGRVKIGIGDVTGHGLESGVLMIMVQTAVRALTSNRETDSVKFLSALNRTIYNNVQRMNSDKNLSLLLLEYEDGELKFTGQHEEIIVVRTDGLVELIDTRDLGFPIGLEANITDFIGENQVQLYSGDVVVLYTDGITEAENIERKRYGLNRLIEVVRLNLKRSATEIRQVVIEEVRAYIGTQKVYDDITLVILKKK
ncbi:MAG: SpoIIE family protein phosphatase [Actinomycetota bacterium]